MATRGTCISIISLFLVNELKAQNAAGCWLTTCDNPGQVRIDAVFNPVTGAFIGGCNCACPPGMADPQSPNFCPEPKIINFDPTTLHGDCSCSCPPHLSPPALECLPPLEYNPETCACECPAYAPPPSACVFPQEFIPSTCSCGCENGNIGGPCMSAGVAVKGSTVLDNCQCDIGMVQCQGNQVPDASGKCGCPEIVNGLHLPVCELPLVRDPITCDCATTTTTTPAPGPISVTCEAVGGCSCPFGTHGSCTITCTGTNDACKDGVIECNNDGYDCIVNCLSGSGCAGSSTIIGPVGGALTVNCDGGQSCEGSTSIDGALSTDVSVSCTGSQACKGGVTMSFGTGINTLSCTGPPDSCQGIPEYGITIPTDAISWSCLGQYCPPSAPADFTNTPITLGGGGGGINAPPPTQPIAPMIPWWQQSIPAGTPAVVVPAPAPQVPAPTIPQIPLIPGLPAWMYPGP